ncbi:MAG: pyridoxal-dependent decarboxylase [Pseudomonadota bacterium]
MSIDPEDWDILRAEAIAALDAGLSHLRNAEEGRVWTPFPENLKTALRFGVPPQGLGLSDVRNALTDMLPYGVGNTHPRFFGWVHGSGDPSGLLAEIVAASMNANCGGRDHAALYVERQVVEWMRGIMGFPKSASGLLVSGTSLATLIALKTAREKAFTFLSRERGVTERLVAYVAEGGHACVSQAMDILGFGTDSLRQVPVDENMQMNTKTLLSMIDLDNEAGLRPFAVIGTAGAVNTGAIDDLKAIADVARRRGIWFHVDGAFGATAMIAPEVAGRLNGIKEADSVAFDFHKWWHVNYDAGCVLIRDKEDHMRAWSDRPDYLAAGEALAGGAPWPTDMGPELSRGFRALKVWAHLLIHGTDSIAEAISRNIEQARMLAQNVAEIPELELAFEPPLNIVCFRLNIDGYDLDGLNAAVVAEVQRNGSAAPSTTKIEGKLMIRVNITNHRTRDEDLDLLLDAILGAAEKLLDDHRLE